MSTAPFTEASVEAHTQSLRHYRAVVATHPDWDEPLSIPIQGGRLTFDEAWAPHAQADLTCPVADPDVLDLLDPRTGVRLEITAGYVLPSGEVDAHTVADLGLRRRVVRRPDNVLELGASSDEALVQDWRSLGGTKSYVSSAATGATIVDLLQYALGSPTVTDTVSSTTTLGEAVALASGDDVWGAIVDIADRDDVWVHDDGLRSWKVRPRPSVAGKSVLVLKVGIGGTIVTSQAVLDREEFANAVIITYKNGARGYARISSGPFDTATAGRKVLSIERDAVPGSAAAAKRAATALVNRQVSRGRGLSLTAVSAYWLRPGHTTTVQLPTGDQERHLVSRVSFDLATGSMDVDTRLPITATITTGE